MYKVPNLLESQPIVQPNSQDDVRMGTESFANGYHFPPKISWTETIMRGLRKYYDFFLTPTGFVTTILGLNVFAWGAMLFLLIINAVPSMCKPTCSDINSESKIWIEINSQILTAIFSMIQFGVAPWRFRDLWYLLRYRVHHSELHLRKLAGINRSWFRLIGSQDLPAQLGPEDKDLSSMPQNALPYPNSKAPDAPLTGIRAPPTAFWKLDLVTWGLALNIVVQAILSGFMWGYDRRNRSSIATGVCVVFACLTGVVAGSVSFVEQRKIKAIEGIEITPEDQLKLVQDREKGILHWNNIKDKRPKRKNKRFTEKEGNEAD
ncbi:hypothetical protein K3495_g10528 [Podosphaera aphanis]|nr:hypothetical protein K3495_g10528 [Podosphaera aphanis]